VGAGYVLILQREMRGKKCRGGSGGRVRVDPAAENAREEMPRTQWGPGTSPPATPREIRLCGATCGG
jgi:hypothetical protein